MAEKLGYFFRDLIQQVYSGINRKKLPLKLQSQINQLILGIKNAFDFSTGTPKFCLVESDFDEINDMVDKLTWILFEIEENNINQTREAGQLFCIDCNRDDIFCICGIDQLDQPYPVQPVQPVQPIQLVQPVQPAQPAQPVQPF